MNIVERWRGSVKKKKYRKFLDTLTRGIGLAALEKRTTPEYAVVMSGRSGKAKRVEG